jgi:hypothetical protein
VINLFCQKKSVLRIRIWSRIRIWIQGLPIMICPYISISTKCNDKLYFFPENGNTLFIIWKIMITLYDADKKDKTMYSKLALLWIKVKNSWFFDMSKFRVGSVSGSGSATNKVESRIRISIKTVPINNSKKCNTISQKICRDTIWRID